MWSSPVSTCLHFAHRTSTHSLDTDQRRIPLFPHPADMINGFYQYSLAIPGDPGITLPGIWMLFAVTSDGVPSVSVTIQIRVS